MRDNRGREFLPDMQVYNRLTARVFLGPILIVLILAAAIWWGMRPHIQDLLIQAQVMAIGIPPDRLAEVSQQIAWRLVVALFFVSIPGIVWMAFNARNLTTTLTEMRAVLQRIRNGDFNARLPVEGTLEVSALRLQVNNTARDLGGRIAELERSRRRLLSVLDGMTEGVLVTDEKGVVILVNRALTQILRTELDALGRTPLEIYRSAELAQALEQARDREEPITVELQLQLPDVRHVVVRLARWEDPTGPGGLVAVLHDITDMRRLEQVRRDFVANASHELRTPVAAIRGYAEALQDGEPLPQEARTCVDVIERHARRLASLVDDILLLARLESPAYTMEMGAVNLHHACETVVRAIGRLAREQQIQIETRFEADLPDAHADREALEHVLINLIDNAIKYTQPGAVVTVAVKSEHDHVVIDVTDNGPGIAVDDQPRIFERFYRTDPARSKAMGGTGLGLSIVKHLVLAMGGEVSVESMPGHGATFRVRLPISN